MAVKLIKVLNSCCSLWFPCKLLNYVVDYVESTSGQEFSTHLLMNQVFLVFS